MPKYGDMGQKDKEIHLLGLKRSYCIVVSGQWRLKTLELCAGKAHFKEDLKQGKDQEKIISRLSQRNQAWYQLKIELKCINQKDL